MQSEITKLWQAPVPEDPDDEDLNEHGLGPVARKIAYAPLGERKPGDAMPVLSGWKLAQALREIRAFVVRKKNEKKLKRAAQKDIK